MLGGTFNPPHLGHLSAARQARRELALDRVLLVPVHTPPHKEAEDDPGVEHRLAMARLLAGEEPWLEVDELELERGGPSYTVDTLRTLHGREPGAQLTLIVGADMARTLPAWREPREILRLADVAVAERDGASRTEIARALERELGCRAVKAAELAQERGPGGRIAFLDMPQVPVSSTEVRRAAAAGESLQEMVTPAVAGYIAAHRLYTDEEDTA